MNPKAIPDAAPEIVSQATAEMPTLEQLLDGVTPENCHPPTDWGKPAGREAW